jgi:hypothetical protein
VVCLIKGFSAGCLVYKLQIKLEKYFLNVEMIGSIGELIITAIFYNQYLF